LEVDPITGKAKPMPGKRWRTIRDFVWLPDGSGLLLAAQDKSGVTDQLWLTAYPGGERRRISNDLMVYSSVSVYRYKGRPEKRRRRQETKCALFSVLECNRDATLSALWPLATLSSPREKPGKKRKETVVRADVGCPCSFTQLLARPPPVLPAEAATGCLRLQGIRSHQQSSCGRHDSTLPRSE